MNILKKQFLFSLSLITISLSSCTSLLAPSGTEKTLERDVSGLSEIDFSQSFSTWGKLSAQEVAIFFSGEAIKRENAAKEQQFVDIYVTQAHGDRALKISKYSQKKERNEVIDLKIGERTLITASSTFSAKHNAPSSLSAASNSKQARSILKSFLKKNFSPPAQP